jgi:predicted transcriptional regulator
MAGRPKHKFTEQQVEQIRTLARCHCPDSEIAAFMGVGEATIQRHFDALLKESREAGKANIRAKQYRMAMEGDRAMLIWLGKQLLKQSDKVQWDITSIPDDVFAPEVARRLQDETKK